MMGHEKLPKYCSRFGPSRLIYFRHKTDLTRMPDDAASEDFKIEYERLMKIVRRGGRRGQVMPFDDKELQGVLKRLIMAARQRARKSGRVHTLPKLWAVEEYQNQHGLCALSGVIMRKPTRPWDPYGPSIDRIDSSMGYTPENCQLTAYAVNRAKSEMSYDELVEFCRAVVRKHGRTKAEQNRNVKTGCKMQTDAK